MWCCSSRCGPISSGLRSVCLLCWFSLFWCLCEVGSMSSIFDGCVTIIRKKFLLMDGGSLTTGLLVLKRILLICFHVLHILCMICMSRMRGRTSGAGWEAGASSVWLSALVGGA